MERHESASCKSTFLIHLPWTPQELSPKPHSWQRMGLGGKGKLKSRCKPARQGQAPDKAIPETQMQVAGGAALLCQGQQDRRTVPAKGLAEGGYRGFHCLHWAASPGWGQTWTQDKAERGENVLLLLKTSCCFHFKVSDSLDLIKFEEGNEE